MKQPSRAATPILAVLVASSLLVACTGQTPGIASTSASPPASPPAASVAPSQATAASPTSSAQEPLLTACLTLGPQDCERARSFAVTTLTAGDPPVRYVQVGPFSCATGDRCPLTLVARPEGDVVLEFPGGAGVNVHLKIAPDGTFEATRDAAMGVPVEPSSPDVEGGPMPFSLGHCGIFSGIDVDGAWWDPVGVVDMETGDAVNATAGTLTFLDEDHASFTTATGFDVQLIRRDGPKLLPMCM